MKKCVRSDRLISRKDTRTGNSHKSIKRGSDHMIITLVIICSERLEFPKATGYSGRKDPASTISIAYSDFYGLPEFWCMHTVQDHG